MRPLYTLIFYLSLPFVMLRMLWRSRYVPAYRQRWLERFAIFPKPQKTNGLWVHAVSLGEVIAATPLIKSFKKNHPHDGIIITTTTPSGSTQVQKTFGSEVEHVYLPYDLPNFIKRFILSVKPRCVVIMETELWPNLLEVCAKASIPVLLLNARLSERSMQLYQYIRPLSFKMMQHISQIAVQTAVEAERYIKLGAKRAQLQVTGNLKFDINIPEDLSQKALELKQQLGIDRPTWIAASTHEGEENFILEAFEKIKAEFPDCLLILVPRHPDRFIQVKQLCQKLGYEVILRSEQKIEPGADIFIGNTIGELLLFYAVADIAFVGGSLIPVGGHNLLEPAALAKPSITGPHLHNFQEISRLLLAAKATEIIHHPEHLATQVVFYLSNKELAKAAGQKGMQVVLDNKGALAKQIQILEEYYK